MIGLTIETSCDETSVAILRDGREVLSNIVSTQIEIHKNYGGVVPEIASREHISNISYVVEEAIREAANCNKITDWVHSVVDGLNPSIKDYSKKQIDLALALILHEQVIRDATYNDILIRFAEVYKAEGGVF